MIKFRSEYEAKKGKITLSPKTGTVLLGSCFADNMRQKMNQGLWNAINPFGTLFNPLSIALILNLALQNKEKFKEAITSSIFKNGEIWSSWLFNSKFSASSPGEVTARALEARKQLLDSLENAEAMFITFGTAYCYFLTDSTAIEYLANPFTPWHVDNLVANCHKQPQRHFNRQRISIHEITSAWSPLILSLHEQYPNLQIIFTVSPVRHLSDGMTENNRSKATLILAVDNLSALHPQCSYFPAYEIVNDDLRDYRFYAQDLAHPNDLAIEYIWEKFKTTYLDAKGLETLRLGEAAWRRSQHRQLLQ